MRILSYIVGNIGTNCYLVWDEPSLEAMLIDPGGYAAEIQHDIDANGLDLKYIVLTHGHFDHVLGVVKFLESDPGARVAGGKADESFLSDVTNVKPDIYLNDGDDIKLGNLNFLVIETPGHTPGSLSLYIAEYDTELVSEHFSGTVFTGDTLFHMSVGRTDLGGGDFQTLVKSIREKLFILPDDTLVLPGHMDASTIGTEKKYNPFLRS